MFVGGLFQSETGSYLSFWAELSFCVKQFSKKGSRLRSSSSNNHSRFLCHVTLYFLSIYSTDDKAVPCMTQVISAKCYFAMETL